MMQKEDDMRQKHPVFAHRIRRITNAFGLAAHGLKRVAA